MLQNGLSRKERAKWTTLIVMIIIFIVDASNLEHETRILETSNSNTTKETKNLVQEQITYEGDQVWRIHKPKEGASYVNELVQRYDADGCT